MRKRILIPKVLIILVLSLFLVSGIAISVDGKVKTEEVVISFDAPDKAGIPRGWKLKEKRGDAEFKVIKEDSENVIYLKSNSASFSFEKPIDIDPKKYPYVVWKWKVLRLPEAGDVRAKKKNDQAAQLLVLFDGKRSISYVWDTGAPEGTVMDESIGWPVNIKIKVLVVKSGGADLNKWISFERNILEDYRRLYNEDPTLIKGIRIQINTQYTGTIAETFFGNIVFRKASR